MDRTVEERFIRQYVKEDRQERLLFELFSKKNRKKALSRFAHGAELLLKPGYRKCAAIDLSFLKQVKTAYVIPSDGDLDGAETSGETVFSLPKRNVPRDRDRRGFRGRARRSRGGRPRDLSVPIKAK